MLIVCAWALSLVIVSSAASYATVLITGANVKNGSLTGKDVKDSSLLAPDLASNSVAAAEVQANAVGASELQSGSVSSAKILDGTIALGDLSSALQSYIEPADGHTVAVSGFVSQTGVATVAVTGAYNSLGGTPTVTLTNGVDYNLTIPGFDPVTNVLMITPSSPTNEYSYSTYYDSGNSQFLVHLNDGGVTTLSTGEGFYFLVA